MRHTYIHTFTTYFLATFAPGLQLLASAQFQSFLLTFALFTFSDFSLFLCKKLLFALFVIYLFFFCNFFFYGHSLKCSFNALKLYSQLINSLNAVSAVFASLANSYLSTLLRRVRDCSLLLLLLLFTVCHLSLLLLS